MFNRTTNYPIFFTIPILIYFIYLFINFILDPNFFTSFYYINIALHEWWHAAVMMIWNQFLIAAAWTIMQLLIPISLMIWFYKQRDFFWLYLWYALIWINLFQIAPYAWDAKKMNLPMLKFFWEWNYIHDWNYMLTEMWILWYTEIISWGIYYLGIICFLVCFIFTWSTIINRFREI